MSSFSYLSLLIGFGFGIYKIMKRIDNRRWVTMPSCQHEVRDSLQPESLIISISSLQFHELDDTIYNLFWTLLDPGAIGKFGCTCITQRVSRYLSMFLFGLYLLLTYIIILNLLIALMSTKITNITEKGVSLKDHSVLMMTI